MSGSIQTITPTVLLALKEQWVAQAEDGYFTWSATRNDEGSSSYLDELNCEKAPELRSTGVSEPLSSQHSDEVGNNQLIKTQILL